MFSSPRTELFETNRQKHAPLGGFTSQRHPCEWAKSMTVGAEVPNSIHPRSASQLMVAELRSPLFRPERMPHEDGQQYHHLHLQLVELTSVLSGE
jgi:hypothetical protein